MANNNEQTLLKKVDGIANVLASAGVGYTDYLTQLTYILFLKMDSEKEELGLGSKIPKGYKWNDLKDLNGEDLVDKYEDILKDYYEDILEDCNSKDIRKFNISEHQAYTAAKRYLRLHGTSLDFTSNK